MDMQKKLLICLAIFFFVSLPARAAMVTTAHASSTQQPQVNSAQQPQISPQAIEYLNNMEKYLSSLKRFKTHVNQTTEIIFPNDQRVHSDRELDVSVERPNRMRIDLKSAKRQVQLIYDGKNLSLYSPKLNYYATVAAKPTIKETVNYISDEYNIDFPVFDLMQQNRLSSILSNAQTAAYVGDDMIDGVRCHQLAFQQQDIDWQIWIEDSPTPLPRRIIVNDKTQKGEPQSISTFSNWDLSPTFQANLFNFTPPEGAKRIQFLTVQNAGQQQLEAESLEPVRNRNGQQLQPVRNRVERLKIIRNRERLAKQ